VALDGSERREHRRIPSSELPATALVGIQGRGPASLIDLSPGGALLDLPFHVRPESRITLAMNTAVERLVVPFQLLRCYVVGLEDGVRYRAAGAFEQTITSFAGRNLWSDSRVDALTELRQASQNADVMARGTSFNDLLEWTIIAARQGEDADNTSEKIKAHLQLLFPSLAIGHMTPASSPETSTLVRFSDVGLRSKAPLLSSERRFLKASAQLLKLLSKESPPPAESPLIIRSISDWVSITR